jgi:hypothetical protein
MLRNLFSSRPDHPLGDVKELKRTIAELSADNSFKSADEIYGWFESLQHANDFRVDHFFDVVRQLDEAAQIHVRRLTRNYLQAPRLSKSEERRLWSMCFNYWGEVASLYARCLDRVAQSPKDKGSETLKPLLPLITARLVAARANQMKWVAFRYGALGDDLWRGLGLPYLAAEAGGYSQKPVQLYPAQPVLTTVAQQYVQALIVYTSSMDSLTPVRIELADRISAHFQSRFVLSAACLVDSVHWIYAASGSPPVRLIRQPEQALPGLRFFSPGSAEPGLQELMRVVERGDLPPDVNLGGEYAAKTLLPVLRHLAAHWAAQPPLREHSRHAVKTRIAVVHGFDDCFTIFAGDVARLGKERSAESWVVENVSRGGFGAAAEDLGDWLSVGALLAIQPEGGENWVLGVVRRYQKDSDAQASVGIQTLSRVAQGIQLRPRVAGFSATGVVPAIWLRDPDTNGEARVVLPFATFDLRQPMEFFFDGRSYLMTPVELEEAGGTFEIGRYREQSIAG